MKPDGWGSWPAPSTFWKWKNKKNQKESKSIKKAAEAAFLMLQRDAGGEPPLPFLSLPEKTQPALVLLLSAGAQYGSGDTPLFAGVNITSFGSVAQRGSAVWERRHSAANLSLCYQVNRSIIDLYICKWKGGKVHGDTGDRPGVCHCGLWRRGS